jgi:hypothetical protein
MAQILPGLNFGEISASESAENADFFHIIKNMYTQLAQNLIADQPPPPSYIEPLLKMFLHF